jgi:integrase
MNVAKGSLEELIDGFISFKRAIGHSYGTEAYYLNQFRLFCNKRDCFAVPSKADFIEWMKRRPEELPQSQHTRLSPVRQLYLYMRDIGCEISFVLPKSVRNGAEKYRPHFLREEEVGRFFDACDNLNVKKENPCREIILPAAFRLMYCCGLRPLEAIRLKTADVHIKDSYIDIIGSKNHKDRRLFISRELADCLSEYARKISSAWPGHEYFFPKSSKGRYDDAYLSTNFRKIWKSAGGQRFGPAKSRVRLYDLRHHFAFANINRWIREGRNANAMVAYLCRFMGHSTIESTYYYLHLVPDFFDDYANTVRGLSDILPEVEYED